MMIVWHRCTINHFTSYKINFTKVIKVCIYRKNRLYLYNYSI